MARAGAHLTKTVRTEAALTEAAATAAATIAKYQLLDPNRPLVGSGGRGLILAAFSGGADSAALFLILRRLGYRLTLGHIDHGMRPGSAADAEHCRMAAAGWGVPILVTRLDQPPATEAQARRDRYQTLQRMAAEAGADRIATGHTLDDQAETVKMRLNRGGFGLGIPPKRGCIIRPLLQIRRQVTESVCREAGYSYLTDPTNADLRYTRNRVRRELQQAGDQAILDLARMADASRAEVEAIAQIAAGISASAVTVEDDLVFIDRSIAKNPKTARAVLRMVLSKLEIDPSAQLIDDILTKVVPVTGARLDLPGGLGGVAAAPRTDSRAPEAANPPKTTGGFGTTGGLAVWAEPDHLLIGDPAPLGDLPEIVLRNPGVTQCPEWGFDIEIEQSAPPKFTGQALEEFFDPTCLGAPLKIRQWQPGDRFQPLGMQGFKKLQDYFVDAKVPRRARDRIPILVCGDRIVWVAGHRIDDRFKVPNNSRSAVRIKIKVRRIGEASGRGRTSG